MTALVLAAAVSAEKAQELYQAKEYAPALAAYVELAKEQPKNPMFAFRQGAALLAMGRGAEAIPHFEKAGTLGFPPPLMQAWSARAQAKSGKLDAAAATLKQAAAGGFANVAMLDDEADFAALRASAGFKALREAVDRNARPCAYAPEYRQMDFWVGVWDVTSSGAPAGVNRIEKSLGDCVIVENWTGTSGLTGKSFNIWDVTRKEWRQSWVDSSGTITEYHGTWKDGTMTYLATSLLPDANGTLQETQQRMTFFDQKGTIRQLGESSTDGGKTWTVAYDLVYHPKKS
jgi:tetratricopeptide (TPR) repeat protein